MNCRLRVYCLAALLACFFAPSGFSQECLELVGRWPYGPASAVAVSGEYAYFASGPSLMVADISDPASPQVVGEVEIGLRIIDMAVDESHAYLLSDARRLTVVDVSVPEAPVKVGFHEISHDGRHLKVANGYAYVTMGDAGLLIIDVATPSMLVEVGLLEGQASDVALAGDHAYVVSDSTFWVADVSIPSSPVGIANCPNAIYTESIAVSGNIAYAASRNEFQVFDVSDPSSPQPLGESQTVGWETIEGMVVVDSNVMLIGTGVRVVEVFDVSTPSTPVQLNRLDIASSGFGVAESGGFAVIAAGREGLLVTDMRSPGCSFEVGRFDTTGAALDVAVVDDVAYLSDQQGGFRVIDISTPSVPVEVSSYDSTDFVEWLTAADDRVYASAGPAGLLIVDVSDPSSPRHLGVFDPQGNVRRAVVSGAHAYVDVDRSLRVVDVSDPSAPAEVAVVGGYLYIEEMVLLDDHLFIAERDTGLRVFDVTTPSEPAEVGHVDPLGWFSDLAVGGGYAFLADTDGGLRVIDIRVPSAPSEVCHLDYGRSSRVRSVTVSRDRVFASTGKGLYVADLSAPCTEVFLGWCRDQTFPDVVSGSFGYVADYSQGLAVLDLSGPFGPTKVGELAKFGTNDAVATAGDFAYIAGSNGLWILDVKTTPMADLAGFAEIPLLRDVEVSAGYAYVAGTHEDGLRVLDVGDPWSPVEVWSYDRFGDQNLDLEVSESLLFVVTHDQTSFYNVSVPTSPNWVGGRYLIYGDLRDLEVFGDYVYITDDYGFLYVIDISRPSDPVVLDRLAELGGPAIKVVENTAYVAQVWGMLVLDVSDPALPVPMSFFSTLSRLTDVTTAGTCAFVVDDEAVRAVDVSAPHAPVEVGIQGTAGPATDLAVLGIYLYVTEGWAGFEIFDISECPGAVIKPFRQVGGRQIPVAP